MPFLGALSRLPSLYSAESPVVVSEIVKILGPLLEHWKGDYNAVGTSDDSSYRKSAKLIEAMIKHVRPNVSQTEREHIVPSMMSKGFCYCLSVGYPQRNFNRTLHLKPSWKYVAAEVLFFSVLASALLLFFQREPLCQNAQTQF